MIFHLIKKPAKLKRKYDFKAKLNEKGEKFRRKKGKKMGEKKSPGLIIPLFPCRPG